MENRVMKLDEIAEQRRRTESLSTLLYQQLLGHLSTLKPLFAPQRLLGKHAGGKVEVGGADRALSRLHEKFKGLPGSPYNLPRDFDPQLVAAVGEDLQIFPWEYTHEAKTDDGSKPITMTSPLRWMLTYAGTYTLSQFRRAIQGLEPRRPELIRQFVVNALVMDLVMHSQPGLMNLFAELRYKPTTLTPTEFPGLPITAMDGCLPSYRPPDDVILAAIAFSGVPAFIELVDLDHLADFPDPLRDLLTKSLE
jgi:hypothetical protein